MKGFQVFCSPCRTSAPPPGQAPSPPRICAGQPRRRPGALPSPGASSSRPAAPVRRTSGGCQGGVQRRGAAAASTLALAVVARRGARLGRAEVIVIVTEAGSARVMVVVLRSRRQVQPRLPAQQGQGHLVIAGVPSRQVVKRQTLPPNDGSVSEPSSQAAPSPRPPLRSELREDPWCLGNSCCGDAASRPARR